MYERGYVQRLINITWTGMCNWIRFCGLVWFGEGDAFIKFWGIK